MTIPSLDQLLFDSALDYHRHPKPGKLEVNATKAMGTQRDLALAYSPGVAAPCQEIARDNALSYNYTARGNLVAVISNGTAVLGLGNIGPSAAKPVMEGKAVLFKKFAGIDVFDLEINEADPEKLIDIIASLEPTFGGINLEDIKAPECFYIEKELSKRLKIPVFHDDQHGTAIIVAAAILNGLELVNKKTGDVKVVCSGAGAAAIACLQMLEKVGIKKHNIYVADSLGIIHQGRADSLDEFKLIYKQNTEDHTLKAALVDADIFLGLSVGNIVQGDMIKAMAPNPLILALANPNPEIDPEIAKQVRPDAIIATGRSDFPNQVNNVLCFPYIFRAALDVRATTINDEMKIACVHAIANLAKAEPSDVVASAYSDSDLTYGPTYIIPKPFDPRLMTEIAPRVAQAAMQSGVAQKPIDDFQAYHEYLSRFIYRSSIAMKPIFTMAKAQPLRVVYAEGEDERVLRAAQVAVDEKLAYPILIGRRRVLESRLKKLNLRFNLDSDVTVVDPEDDPRFSIYWHTYYQLMNRKGVSPEFAKTIVRTNTTVIAALMVQLGDADAMLCGAVGRYRFHLESVQDILGLQPGVQAACGLTVLNSSKGIHFITDGYVNPDPTAVELANNVKLSVELIKFFGSEPRVALLSHSNFGTTQLTAAPKMRAALTLIQEMMPDLEIDGEMHADSALDPIIRAQSHPDSNLKGEANLLVMPTIDAANISINMLKVMCDAQIIGPVLLGINGAAHVISSATTVRGLVNMTAMAVLDGQRYKVKTDKIG